MLLVFILFNSCTLERELAKESVDASDSISILLLPPEFLYKTNQKNWEIKNFENLDEWGKDSALFENSLFLKEIDDSVFYKNYLGTLVEELKLYGLKVFDEKELDTFMTIRSRAYIISISQLELEEYLYPYTAEEMFFDTMVYYKEFNLNAININSWYEISKLNDTEAASNLLYASHYLIDNLEGRFVNNIFTEKVSFKYNIDTITVDDIYLLANILGRKYAGYIFDYLINEYVFRNFPANHRPNIYFHYNRIYKSLSPAGDDRFIFMER